MKKYTIEEILSSIILGIMAIIAFINVLSRYIFKLSIAAIEELEINFFVWLTILGIALAFEKGSHLNMTIIYNKFPKWMKKISIIISSILAIILFAIVNYFAIREIYMDLTLFHMRSEALNIPNWIYVIGIPIFSIFVFKKIITSTVKNIKNLK
ncbi:MAG: TRAP transporter small permease subunit [Caldisericia bacterium]|nr:TRAP transporter small permease subunit [Caldisericia bacterium]